MSASNSAGQPNEPSVGNGPKLLDQLRDRARQHGHPESWCDKSVQWCRRFILFHGKRHPKEMGVTEIARFLEHVVVPEIPTVMTSGSPSL